MTSTQQPGTFKYGKVVRAPSTDPLRTVTFAPGSREPAANRFVRRVGRPRNEWAGMLQKECLKMGIDVDRAIHVEQEWRRAVYEYCMR